MTTMTIKMEFCDRCFKETTHTYVHGKTKDKKICNNCGKTKIWNWNKIK